MWYSKMYFSEKREFFQFDASGSQGAPSTCREFSFLPFWRWTARSLLHPWSESATTGIA